MGGSGTRHYDGAGRGSRWVLVQREALEGDGRLLGLPALPLDQTVAEACVGRRDSDLNQGAGCDLAWLTPFGSAPGVCGVNPLNDILRNH